MPYNDCELLPLACPAQNSLIVLIKSHVDNSVGISVSGLHLMSNLSLALLEEV